MWWWVGQNARDRQVASGAKTGVPLKLALVGPVLRPHCPGAAPSSAGAQAPHTPHKEHKLATSGSLGSVHGHKHKGEGDGCRCPEGREVTFNQLSQEE